MAINTDIWGLPENWNTFDDDNIIAVIKQPSCKVGEYNYRTFFRLAEYDKISLDSDIDTSLCVSGMGSECPYSNINYYTVKNGAVESDTQTRNLTNWFFFNTSQKSAYTDQNYVTYLYSDDHYGQYRNFENTLTETNNGNRWISPFIDYNIKDFVLLLRVECSDSPTGSQKYYFLDEYLSTYYNTYPYVFRIFARLYAKAQTTPLRRKYIYQGVIEGSKYCTTAICDNYETTLVENNKRVYCNHISSQRGDNIPVWGSSIDKNFTYFPCNSYSEYGLIGIVYGDNSDFETTVQSGNLYVYHHVTDITAFAEKARRAAAAFGCYFTGDENTAEYGSLTDTKMYIGILDDSLIAHGDYLQGTDTANAIQNDWNSVRDSSYNPKQGVDPNTYSKETSLPIAAMGSSYKYYLPLNSSGSAVLSMLEEIANYPDPQDSWIFDRQFVFQEPIECILAWRHIHLKPPDVSGQTPSHLKLGWFIASENTSQGYIYGGECARVKIAEIDIFPHYGDFRDYEPYSTYAIYVPFCGIKELPTSTFMGHKLNLYLNKNYRTGDVEALIFCDNIYWGNMHGNASIELPLSGKQSAEYIKRRMELQNASDNLFGSTLSSILGNAAGATISSAHGNPGGAAIQAFAGAMNLVNGIAQYTQIKTELEHTPNKIVNIQKGSSSTSILSVMNPYILILRPKFSNGYNEELFAKTRGFATLENRMKNSLKGYSECENPILDGIPCTDTERKLIVQALEEGCIFDTD